MWKLLAVGLSVLQTAQAIPQHPGFFHHQDRLNAEFGVDDSSNRLLSTAASVVFPETVTLPVDHFGKHTKTFENRYWVLEEFYKPGSPVFIYDAGEGDAEPGVQNRLVANGSFFRQIVSEFSGLGIVWEHRYYGKSTPYNITLETPAEQMQWLDTAQALADVPAFASNFSRPNFPHSDLTPASTPWIFVGGSYPGMRAAFVREKYPETIFASFASSAPVQAQVDMSIYFEQVYRGLNGLGFSNCTADIHAAIDYIDDQLANPATAAAIKKHFLGKGADKNSNEGLADVLTYIFYSWQSYEVEGTPGPLREFCDWIATDPATGKLSSAEGWAKKKGGKWAADRWAQWPKFAEVVNYYTPTNCEGFYGNSSTGTTECRLDDAFPDPAAISWTWQYCSEWGFFQSANLGPTSIVSKYNSLKHQQDICYRQFPNGLSSGLLPKTPRVDKVNGVYGGWNIRPSNVYFSGGEFDPWRTLSTLSSEAFAPKGISLTQEIPECNKPTPKNKIFGYLLKGAAHCFDFRTTWPDGDNSRQIFKDALKKWLKCFKPKKY
ncbi:hypothetical protein Q9L58_004156 [Maublancomyces gigas]|uniref:Uncharacterized protein n=1 Tax=Discina gigas TaxID=1032678 RepID=A0ABR3GLK2_9PEZI